MSPARLVIMLGIAALTAAPVCGGGDSPPATAGGGCPAGTKPCGAGCIFTSWICCGDGPKGTGYCNPTTAGAGVSDGKCLPAAPGACTGGTAGVDSQFCCNASGQGTTDCPPPKHFCASSASPATICTDAPCCPPGREAELGCTPPAGPGGPGGPGGPSLGCPSIYDGTYAGDFAYEIGQTHRDPSGATVNDPPKPGSFHVTITLACLATANGTVILTVSHAAVTEPTFGCSDCTPGAAATAALPATPPTNASTPSTAGMGISLGFPNGKALTTSNSPGELTVSADGRTLSNTVDGTCDGPKSAWSDAGDFPSRTGTWCLNWTHWTLTKQ